MSIAKLAAVKPAGDAFGAFALAAHLADLAIEAALELGQMPGVQPNPFWSRASMIRNSKGLEGMVTLPEARSTIPAALFGTPLGGAMKSAERNP